jgi:hypothetical protein
VDSNDFGYGHRSGLAAKADATLWHRCTPEMLSFRRRDPASCNAASSLLKNLEMESFFILAGRCWGGAVELDVIF